MSADALNELYKRYEREAYLCDDSWAYYDACFRLKTVGIQVPEELASYESVMGYPRMYVDAITHRLIVDSFRLVGSDAVLAALLKAWKHNDMERESQLAMRESLIFGRAYVTTAAPTKRDETDQAVIRAESPLSMYVSIDQRTRRPDAAVRIYAEGPIEYPNRDEYATLMLPNRTEYWARKSKGEWRKDLDTVHHNLGFVPVEVLSNRNSLRDLSGSSIITPELRSITDASSRILMNLQAASELMAIPQRLLLGITREKLIEAAGGVEYLPQLYYNRILGLGDSDVKATQWDAAELHNFTQVLEYFTRIIGAYTGLPPQYLSFSSENPPSAEAIKSAETRLIKTCEQKHGFFGPTWCNVLRNSQKVMRKSASGLEDLEAIWINPSTPTFASQADAVVKLAATQVPDGRALIPLERARRDLKYTVEELKEMELMDKANPVLQLSQLLEAPQHPALPGDNSNDTSRSVRGSNGSE